MTTETRLWFVRHGPTHARRMVGWTDLPADLSDAAKIARLDAALPHAPVVSSDLIRAVATADAVAGDRPRLAADRDLREFHYGDWEDRSIADLPEAETRPYFETPGDIRAPGGESWNDVAARVEAALARLPGGNVIVVCHFGVILTQWARATGLAPHAALAQPLGNLGLTRIDWTDSGPVPVFADRHP
ncbi:MAG: histidine phosphatase family protein [Pseudomonadota bacterium]